LGEVSDRSSSQNLASSGKSLTSKDLGEGALTRTISTNKSDAISMIDANRDIFYEESGPSTKFNTLGSNHYVILLAKKLESDLPFWVMEFIIQRG